MFEDLEGVKLGKYDDYFNRDSRRIVLIKPFARACVVKREFVAPASAMPCVSVLEVLFRVVINRRVSAYCRCNVPLTLSAQYSNVAEVLNEVSTVGKGYYSSQQQQVLV